MCSLSCVAGLPGYGVWGPGVWKTRDVENAALGGIRGVLWKARATIFSPWYEFSSLKLEAKYFLGYIVMNINSLCEKENRHSRANGGRECTSYISPLIHSVQLLAISLITRWSFILPCGWSGWLPPCCFVAIVLFMAIENWGEYLERAYFFQS